MERPPVPPKRRVLRRLRQLRREAHLAPGLRGGRHRTAGRDAGQRRRHRDPALRAGRRPRLRVDGEPALPGEDRSLRRPGLSPGRHPPPACSPSTSTWRSGTSSRRRPRCAATARGRPPTPTPRSRWSTRPGTPPPEAWSTPRSSPGARAYFAPEILHSPEVVTVHEAGHQFWYGLVGNNEFEEAWLDEGFNSYHEEKATWLWLGPAGVGQLLLRPQRRPRWPHGFSGGGARRERRSGNRRPRGPPRQRRERRDGPPSLGVPRPLLVRPQLLRQAGTQPADPRGSRGRRHHDAHPAHLRAPIPVRPPHEPGLHRHRERGHGPGLAVVLRRDVVLVGAVRLRRGRAQPAYAR